MFKLLAFFITTLSIFSPAMAAETFQAQGAIASFYAATPSGCVTNHRFMFAARESTRSGGSGEARETVYITEYDYDACLGVTVANWTGYKTLAKHEFDIRNGYARVMATIEMVDAVRGLSEHRQVDLTWSGTGGGTSGTSNTIYEGTGFKVILRYSGTTEPATVSGYIGTQNITTAGNLEFTRSGSVTIDKK